MGKIVKHKIFDRGITKNSDKPVGNRIMVYFESGKNILCNPANLDVIGFYN